MSNSQHITIIRPKIGKGYTDTEWGAITKFIVNYYEVVTEKIDMQEWLVCDTCQALQDTTDCTCENERYWKDKQEEEYDQEETN